MLEIVTLFLMINGMLAIDLGSIDFTGHRQVGDCVINGEAFTVTTLSQCPSVNETSYLYVWNNGIYVFRSLESQCSAIPESPECLFAGCSGFIEGNARPLNTILPPDFKDESDHPAKFTALVAPTSEVLLDILMNNGWCSKYADVVTKEALELCRDDCTNFETCQCIYCWGSYCKVNFQIINFHEDTVENFLLFRCTTPLNTRVVDTAPTCVLDPNYLSGTLTFIALNFDIPLNTRSRRVVKCYGYVITFCPEPDIAGAVGAYLKNSNTLKDIAWAINNASKVGNDNLNEFRVNVKGVLANMANNTKNQIQKLATASLINDQKLAHTIDEFVSVEYTEDQDKIYRVIGGLKTNVAQIGVAVSDALRAQEDQLTTYNAHTNAIERTVLSAISKTQDDLYKAHLESLTIEQTLDQRLMGLQSQFIELLKLLAISSITDSPSLDVVQRLYKQKVLGFIKNDFGFVVMLATPPCDYFWCGDFKPAVETLDCGTFKGRVRIVCGNDSDIYINPTISWTSNCSLTNIDTLETSYIYTNTEHISIQSDEHAIIYHSLLKLNAIETESDSFKNEFNISNFLKLIKDGIENINKTDDYIHRYINVTGELRQYEAEDIIGQHVLNETYKAFQIRADKFEDDLGNFYIAGGRVPFEVLLYITIFNVVTNLACCSCFSTIIAFIVYWMCKRVSQNLVQSPGINFSTQRATAPTVQQSGLYPNLSVATVV